VSCFFFLEVGSFWPSQIRFQPAAGLILVQLFRQFDGVEVGVVADRLPFAGWRSLS